MYCSIKFRLIYAGFGISAGLMAGSVFAYSYKVLLGIIFYNQIIF